MDLILYLTIVHQQILDVLHQANVQMIVNNHPVCKTKKYDGFVITTRDATYKPKRTQLILCEKVMVNNYIDWQGEINTTLAHEAVHVAQICKSNDGHIRRLGFGKNVV